MRLDGEYADCELRLTRTQKRRVQVCDEAGEPVGNAYVAVHIGGARRELARADAAGWAELPMVAGATEFEVRAEDGHASLPVRGLDDAQDRLVVAAP